MTVDQKLNTTEVCKHRLENKPTPFKRRQLKRWPTTESLGVIQYVHGSDLQGQNKSNLG